MSTVDKSNYPMPHSVRTAEDRTAIRHLAMPAGSVLFFLGGAVAHGAYRWESDTPRRIALFTYSKSTERAFAWPPHSKM